MPGHDAVASGDRKPVLDALSFRYRLDEEVARVRRSGGFLSLAVIQVASPTDQAESATSPTRVLERLRSAVRLEDVHVRDAQQQRRQLTPQHDHHKLHPTSS